MFASQQNPAVVEARQRLGLLYQERANASFRHDDRVRAIEAAGGKPDEVAAAVKAEEDRFIAERDGIQARIDAATIDVARVERDTGAASSQLSGLYQQRVAASFRHDDLRRDIEARKDLAERERDKALHAEDARYLKERAAIQARIDALSGLAAA